MDLSKLMGMFGFDPSAAEELMQDEQMQEMMQDPELQQAMERPETEHLLGQLSGMFAQGGIMPDDVDNLLAGFGGSPEAGTSEQLDGLIAGVEQLFGDLGFGGIDRILCCCICSIIFEIIWCRSQHQLLITV